MLIGTVRKYTKAKTLTPRMLNELIDHIEVHQAEKIEGEWLSTTPPVNPLCKKGECS